MSTGRLRSEGGGAEVLVHLAKPSSMARTRRPMATIVESPIAASMEYRPPTPVPEAEHVRRIGSRTRTPSGRS